jgi:hypothetical protein
MIGLSAFSKYFCGVRAIALVALAFVAAGTSIASAQSGTRNAPAVKQGSAAMHGLFREHGKASSWQHSVRVVTQKPAVSFPE